MGNVALGTYSYNKLIIEEKFFPKIVKREWFNIKNYSKKVVKHTFKNIVM